MRTAGTTGLRLEASGFRLQASGFRLQAPGFRHSRRNSSNGSERAAGFPSRRLCRSIPSPPRRARNPNDETPLPRGGEGRDEGDAAGGSPKLETRSPIEVRSSNDETPSPPWGNPSPKVVTLCYRPRALEAPLPLPRTTQLSQSNSPLSRRRFIPSCLRSDICKKRTQTLVAASLLWYNTPAALPRGWGLNVCIRRTNIQPH